MTGWKVNNMSDHELKSDVKEIRKDIVEIKQTLAKNTVVLEEHARRTTASENRLEKMEYVLVGFMCSLVVGLFVLFFKF